MRNGVLWYIARAIKNTARSYDNESAARTMSGIVGPISNLYEYRIIATMYSGAPISTTSSAYSIKFSAKVYFIGGWDI